MRFFEQQQLTDRVCEKPWAGGPLRRKREESREKREERKWPQARFTTFLQGPVATSINF